MRSRHAAEAGAGQRRPVRWVRVSPDTFGFNVSLLPRRPRESLADWPESEESLTDWPENKKSLADWPESEESLTDWPENKESLADWPESEESLADWPESKESLADWPESEESLTDWPESEESLADWLEALADAEAAGLYAACVAEQQSASQQRRSKKWRRVSSRVSAKDKKLLSRLRRPGRGQRVSARLRRQVGDLWPRRRDAQLLQQPQQQHEQPHEQQQHQQQHQQHLELLSSNAPAGMDAELALLLVQLQHRDVTPEDYDLLLRLDEFFVPPRTADAAAVAELPSTTLDEHAGAVCAVCLDELLLGQQVRLLPCGHQFHAACIDSWLCASADRCPVDNLPVC